MRGDRLVRRRAVVGGRVQGVGFRWATKAQATRRKLAGFVRNRPDGTVEAEIEGPETDVAEFIDWLRSGPPGSAVTKVETSELTPTGERGFRARS